MGDVKLLPCPFCGAEVCEIAFDDEGTGPEGGRRARVECSESESCFANTGWQDDIAEARAAWNRRALTPAQQAAEEMVEALTLAKAKIVVSGDCYRWPDVCEKINAALAKAGKP